MVHPSKLIPIAALAGAVFVLFGDSDDAVANPLQVSVSRQQATVADWRPALIADLKHGDLVFRRGVGPVSESIALAIASTTGRAPGMTHAGIAVQIRPGGPVHILHAIEDRGVTLEPPERFFSSLEAGAGTAIRIEKGGEVSDAAMRYLGRPFDTRFEMSTDGVIYCTELVALALRDAGTGIEVPMRKVALMPERIIFPDDLIAAVSKIQIAAR